MNSINTVLQQIERLENRAARESAPAFGIEAAALAEQLAGEFEEGRYRNLARGLELRLRFAPAAPETAAAFSRAVAAIETGAHESVGHQKIARRSLAGALRQHESSLSPPMRAWLASADCNPLPGDLNV